MIRARMPQRIPIEERRGPSLIPDWRHIACTPASYAEFSFGVLKTGGLVHRVGVARSWSGGTGAVATR
jgi:hypothetical protein